MADFNIQVRGLEQAIQRFNTYPKDVRDRLKRTLEASAQEVRTLAVKDAPGNIGRLRNSTVVTASDGGLTQSTTVNADYGVFMEFGTKTKTRVPGVLQAYAAQFKGASAGSGARDLKTAIEAWVKRKGIGAKRTKSGKVSNSKSSQQAQKQAAFLIARSIYLKGVTPHPFFFKHVFLVRKKLEQEIPKIVGNV